jgi:hypothetical protein
MSLSFPSTRSRPPRRVEGRRQFITAAAGVVAGTVVAEATADAAPAPVSTLEG